jgi:hypothetical protein
VKREKRKRENKEEEKYVENEGWRRMVRGQVDGEGRLVSSGKREKGMVGEKEMER